MLILLAFCSEVARAAGVKITCDVKYLLKIDGYVRKWFCNIQVDMSSSSKWKKKPWLETDVFMSLQLKGCERSKDTKIYKCLGTSCVTGGNIVATGCPCDNNKKVFTCEQSCDGNELRGDIMGKFSQTCSLQHAPLCGITKYSYALDLHCNISMFQRFRWLELQRQAIEVSQMWVGILWSTVSSLQDVISYRYVLADVGNYATLYCYSMLQLRGNHIGKPRAGHRGMMSFQQSPLPGERRNCATEMIIRCLDLKFKAD